MFKQTVTIQQYPLIKKKNHKLTCQKTNIALAILTMSK